MFASRTRRAGHAATRKPSVQNAASWTMPCVHRGGHAFAINDLMHAVARRHVEHTDESLWPSDLRQAVLELIKAALHAHARVS